MAGARTARRQATTGHCLMECGRSTTPTQLEINVRSLPQTLRWRRRTKNNWSFVIVDSIGRLEIQIHILVNGERGKSFNIKVRLPRCRKQHTVPAAVFAAHSCSLCHSDFPSIVGFFIYLFLPSTISHSPDTFISFFLEGKKLSPLPQHEDKWEIRQNFHTFFTWVLN